MKHYQEGVWNKTLLQTTMLAECDWISYHSIWRILCLDFLNKWHRPRQGRGGGEMNTIFSSFPNNNFVNTRSYSTSITESRARGCLPLPPFPSCRFDSRKHWFTLRGDFMSHDHTAVRRICCFAMRLYRHPNMHYITSCIHFTARYSEDCLARGV